MKNRAVWAVCMLCATVAGTLVLDRAVARQFGPGGGPPPERKVSAIPPPMGAPDPAGIPFDPFARVPAPAQRSAEADPVREADELIERLKARRKEDVAAMRAFAQRLADRIEAHREALARAEKALQAVRAAEAELPGPQGTQYIEGPLIEPRLSPEPPPLPEPGQAPPNQT